jgi:large subunit ribosomal protein L17
MRHGDKVKKLGRKSAHRQAMLANMASSLIVHKRINTTLAKGKSLRMYIEPLITKAKTDSTHSRRLVFSYLQNKEAVSELFREISVKVADRPGGYTRILKTGTRLGDNAEMCLIELVDYNENLLETREDDKSKTSRRRRRGAKKKADEVAPKAEAKKAVAKKAELVEEVEDTPAAAGEIQEQAVVKETPEALPEEQSPEAVAEEEVVDEEAADEKPLAEETEEDLVAEAETPVKAGYKLAEETSEEDQEEEKK